MYGYGYTFIRNIGDSVDPDAQAFITAAGITDATQQTAINTLVVSLKANGIWSKMKAIYPFVGNTAFSHKFNLKDPRDLDVAFRLVFNGGWTHSSTGAKPNGTNGYADTFFVPSANQTIFNNGLGCYISANTFLASDSVTMGAFNSAGQASILISKIQSNGVEILDGRLNAGNSPQTIVGRAGNFSIHRTSANVTKLYKNTSVVLNFVSGGTSLPTLNVFLGNMSFGTNSPYASGYTNSEFRLAYLSEGLSDSEVSNLYTSLQAFQTTLGRSVGPQTVSDADAQAFVTAANIQDQVQADAVNNLVIGLKADGLWTKMKAIYPFVGGDATSHSYNLKNTTQFQITWNGGVTHSNLGVIFNGTNGYGNTNLNTNLVSNSANYHQSVYSRTLGGSNSWVEIGNWVTGRINFIQIGNASNIYDNYIFDSQSALGISNGGGQAMFMANRVNTSRKSFRNGLPIQSQTVAVGSNINLNVFVGAVNFNGNPSIYTGRNLSFSTIGDGLTDTDAANLYTNVQAFQTALNRQV